MTATLDVATLGTLDSTVPMVPAVVNSFPESVHSDSENVFMYMIDPIIHWLLMIHVLVVLRPR